MLCVIAKLDEASRDCLLYVQRTVEQFGLARRRLHGHFTLATFVQGPESELIDACRAALCGVAPFHVQYERIAELPETSIVVALLRRTETLNALQRSITAGREPLLDRWTHSDVWLPHTTLVHQPGMALGDVCAAMQAAFTPFEATVARVEFSRVTGDGYEIVDGMDLNGPGR